MGATAAVEMIDTREGADITLECRFSPQIASQDPTLFWQRTSTKDGKQQMENVFVQDRSLVPNYRLDYRPHMGRYDLLISNVTYDRDNGEFVCKVLATGLGQVLHSQTMQVTVLIPPGQPIISPASPTATEGKQMDLICSTTGGSPDPMIHWFKNDLSYSLESIPSLGRSRTAPTSGNHSFIPQKKDDGAVFRCVVSSRAMPEGEQYEANVTLSVNYFPRVSVSAGKENILRVERDSPAVLKCNVDAKPAVSNVRWTRGGRFVATSFTHTIPKVGLSDSGSYVCIADNGLGRPGEAELTLDVLYPPLVAVEARREAEEGESIRVHCNVSANPAPLSVEWIRPDLPEFRQSGSILSLHRITADSAGTYMCRAVNLVNSNGKSYERHGNATLVLRVRHKPGAAKITPEKPIATEGNSIILTCEANPSGWPAPQFRWWKDNSEAAIATGARFAINSAHLNTEGTYHCQANNEMGHGTSASVQLQVHQAPRFIAKVPSQKTKRSGDKDFEISCDAQGKPKPSVRWLKDGDEILPGLMYDIITDESENTVGVGTVKSVLSFTGKSRNGHSEIVPSDRGQYTCIFYNSVKQTESTMQLRVEHQPLKMHQYDKVAHDLGENAKVTCIVKAFPRPDFEWSNKNGKRLPTAIGQHYEVNDTILSEDMFKSVLVINNINEDDYSEYTCTARNAMGYLDTHIRLQRKGPPEKPNSLIAVASTANSVTLQWEPGFNGGQSDTKYFVSYRKVGAPDQISECDNYAARSDPKEGREFDCQKNSTCNVTSLDPHYTYIFKAKAINFKGSSDFSEEVSATTQLDGFPVPQRVTYDPSTGQVAVNLASSCLQLLAHVETRDEHGEWSTFKKVSVGGMSILEFRVPTPSPSPATTTITEAISPASLESETYVRVRLCLQSSGENVCGSFVKAEIGPMYINSAAAFVTPTMVATVVSIVVFVLLVAVIIIAKKCKRTQKKVKKDHELENSSSRPSIVTQQPPPPYYPSGMENKALEHSLDLGLDDPAKTVYGTTPQNGYVYHNAPNGHMSGGVNMPYIDNSYSNSNNGGSVNSQDSLWQAKNGGGEIQQSQSRQYTHYDGHSYGGMDDYGHYPPVQDDYLNQRNNYMATDAYGNVLKPKKRVDHLDSPYHDVSGLPDPYGEHHQVEGDENKTQHLGLSFDESLESGYSTPNSRSRRVIREIIV
ncbi:Hypothetical predicted protein [Cloeon dipterum]|nr:Hypothetical predicted protein [Cloeon dipterum]